MAKKTTLILLILIVGLGLRLINLGQSFWLDEASQALMSSGSVYSIWFERAGDFHPPLFYILAHYWLIFGHSESWLRLLPVSFGIATIYVIYLLAEPRIKVYAALLLAVNPFHVYYSQEFRSYSLLCLLASLSMLFAYRKHFFWLAFINLLLLYTHYAAAFFLFAELCYFVFYNRRDLRKFIVWNLILGIFYLPWLPQFMRQLHSGASISSSLPAWKSVLSLSPIKALPLTLFKLVAGRITFVSRGLYLVYAVTVLLITFVALFLSRKHYDLINWTFVPLFSILLVSFWIPQDQPFRVIFVLIPLTLLIANSFLQFPKLMITLFIYIALVGNLAYFTRPRLQREQWRQAVTFLNAQSGAVLVKFPQAFSPLVWYKLKLPVITPNQASSYLSVYLFQYLTEITDPQLHTESELVQSGFSLARTYNFEGVGFIYRYDQTAHRL